MASSQNEPTFNNGGVSHRSRPGGRTAKTSDRIAAAVVELLIEKGAEECTFTNVAAKAGVERSTLYRRYPNRWAMISEILFARHEVALAVEATGDFRSDLTLHLGKVARALNSIPGRAMVVAAAMARVENAQVGGQYWSNRRDQLQPIIDAAVQSGQICPGIQPDELFAAADGPLFFRMLIAAAPIDAPFIAQVVDNLCSIFCLPEKTTGENSTGRVETAS